MWGPRLGRSGSAPVCMPGTGAGWRRRTVWSGGAQVVPGGCGWSAGGRRWAWRTVESLARRRRQRGPPPPPPPRAPAGVGRHRVHRHRPDALARDQDPVKVGAFRGPSGRCDVDRASDGDVDASAVRAVAVAQKNSFDRRVVVSLDADPGLPALRQLAEGVRRQARRRLEPGPVSPGEHQREDDRRGDRGEERDGRTGQHFGNMLVDVSAPVGSCQPVPDVQ